MTTKLFVFDPTAPEGTKGRQQRRALKSLKGKIVDFIDNSKLHYNFGVLAMSLLGVASPAAAQDNYPSSPVKLVAGFPPAGGTDLVARLLAQKLTGQMNVNFLVENKPGANGNIGAELVAKSTPDGYTLLYNTSGVIFSRALGEKLGYDILKDLAPVSLVTSLPMVLLVHPSLPINTVAEFTANLKANPDKLAYGSGGIGNIIHLATLLFLQANDVTALHVPYKGTAPLLHDAVAGRIQFTFQVPGTAVPLVKDKRMRALAISSLKRSPLLPEVPTLSESMPGFEIGTWHGVMAPAKTPATIVKRLNREIVKVLQDSDIKSRLGKLGAEPLGSTPEEYGAYLRSELDRWTKVIKNAGIKGK